MSQIQCTKEHNVDKCDQCAEFPCEKISSMLERSKEYQKCCKEVCSDVEYEMLEKAFFDKENLTSFVSDSPYLHAFDGLGTVHHQMAERELQNSMNEMDYQLIQLLEYQLPNGKKLVQLDFYKKQ